MDGDFTTGLQAAIEQRGCHALTGRTLPYLALMVWKEAESRVFSVDLTDRPVDVRVAFIGDFVARGWVNCATLRKASSGEWARPDHLVCIKDDYDLGYPAKLTELAYANSTLRPTLSQFIASARADATSAHSYAEFILVRNLGRVLLDESDGAARRDQGTLESLIL